MEGTKAPYDRENPEDGIYGPEFDAAVERAQRMSRCDLTVASVGIGTYGNPSQPFANEVRVSDELKALLVEELELGVNCPDEYPQDVHLVLTFVRHGWETAPDA